MHLSSRVLLIGLAFLAMLIFAAVGSAAWSNYSPSETTFYTYNYPYNGPAEAASGYSYWTNNRVWRPTPHPFWLGYWPSGGSLHYSTDNDSSNPFTWPAYGYNKLACAWDWSMDSLFTSVYPVTCQGYQ